MDANGEVVKRVNVVGAGKQVNVAVVAVKVQQIVDVVKNQVNAVAEKQVNVVADTEVKRSLLAVDDLVSRLVGRRL